MSKHRLVALTFLLLLALGLRLVKLNRYPPGLSPDAAYNGLDADQVITRRRPAIFLSVPWGKEGLIANWIAASFLIFGRSAWSIRLVSVFFGLVGVLGTFLFGQKIRSFKTGWWAAFFLAGSFWHLYLSRAGIRPVMMSAHLTLGLFLLASAFQEKQPKRSFLAGIVFALGFYTYGPYRLTLAVPLLLIWLVGWQGKVAFGFFAGVMTTTMPLLVFIFTNPAAYFERTGEVLVLPQSLGQVLTNLFISADLFIPGASQVNSYGLFHQPMIWWPVSLLTLLGLLIGIWWSRTRRLVLFLGSWLFLGVLVSAVTNEPPSITRTEFVLPAVYLLAALGLELVMKSGGILKYGIGIGLFMAPWVGWRQLAQVSRQPQAEEMFASRLTPVAAMINRINFKDRVYIAQVPIPGGYASHFTDGVIIFINYPKEVFSLSLADIESDRLKTPAWVVATVPRGERFTRLMKIYLHQRPVLRTAKGFLGQTELYLIPAFPSQ